MAEEKPTLSAGDAQDFFLDCSVVIEKLSEINNKLSVEHDKKALLRDLQRKFLGLGECAVKYYSLPVETLNHTIQEFLSHVIEHNEVVTSLFHKTITLLIGRMSS